MHIMLNKKKLIWIILLWINEFIRYIYKTIMETIIKFYKIMLWFYEGVQIIHVYHFLELKLRRKTIESSLSAIRWLFFFPSR